MQQFDDVRLAQLRAMHSSHGGTMSWGEICEDQVLDETPEALRKKIGRFNTRLKYAAKRVAQGIRTDSGEPVLVAEIEEYSGPLVDPNIFRSKSNKSGEVTLPLKVAQVDFERDAEAEDDSIVDDITHKMGVSKQDMIALMHTVLQDYIRDEQKTVSKLAVPQKTVAKSANRRPNANKFGPSIQDMYDPFPEELDDRVHWENFQEELLKKKNFARVMVWSDIHIPDHSVVALTLALRILEIVQPDALIYNGDTCDFDALSSFAKKRRRRATDAIREVQETWNIINDEVDRICPGLPRVALKGNHDNRVDRWNDMVDSPFSDTNIESFVQMMRADGRVWWLGEAQETHFGDLYVQHGKKAGKTASESAARQLGLYGSHLQGHNHAPATTYTRANSARDLGEFYTVQTLASSGCLCNIPPHYVEDTKMFTWIQGIAVADIDLHSTAVNIQNLVFHPVKPTSKNGRVEAMWTSYGNHRITSE